MTGFDRAAFAALAVAARIRTGDAFSGRTLLVRSTSYGDFINLLPALAQCRNAAAPGSIDLLVLSRSGRIADSFLLAETESKNYTIDVADTGHFLRDVRRLRRELLARRYSRVIYCGHSAEKVRGRAQKLGLIRWLTGLSPVVSGFEDGPALRSRRDTFQHLDRRPTHQSLMPFAAMGEAPCVTRREVLATLRLTTGEQERVSAFLHDLRTAAAGKAIAGLYVGSRVARKRWGVDRYAALARLLMERGTSIVLLGAEEDQRVSDDVRAAIADPTVTTLVGQTSLREGILLYGGLDLVIGNDGAPIHLAALGGSRVVSVFCNWEPPGIWEPILGRASRSVRPAWSLRREPDDFGVSTIPVSVVLESALQLLDRCENHTIVTVDGSANIAEERIGGFPFLDEQHDSRQLIHDGKMRMMSSEDRKECDGASSVTRLHSSSRRG